MAGAHCVSFGARPRSLREASRATRNGMGRAIEAGCPAYGRGPRRIERISGALRSCDGRVVRKAPAGAAALGHGGPYVGRSCGHAGIAGWHGEVAAVCRQKEISGEVAMLCDKYKEALIEAAAGGTALSDVLREHVEACVHCGAMLADERILFAAVDAGLHKAANARVRPSFVPNVKAKLATETVPGRNPIPGWAFVPATAALALAVVFLSLPWGAHDKALTAASAGTSKVPARAGAAGLSVAPEHKIRYSAQALKVTDQQNVSGAASHEPEVLIQPEEEEFLKRFYAAVRTPAGEAKVVITDNHEVTPKPLVIEQIEVTDLKIENLDEEAGLARARTK